MKMLRAMMCIAACAAVNAQALEVDREVTPRVTLGGRVVSTVDVVQASVDPNKANAISDEESHLLLRVDKRLYGDGVAGAVLEFREDADHVHFGDHYVFFWNRALEVQLGHQHLRDAMIEFPTLREDDLLHATRVGNASSNQNFEQTHGDLASVDFSPGSIAHSVGVWAGSRTDDPNIGVTGIDTYGLHYVFAGPEALRYMMRVRRAGVMLDRQKVNTGIDERWMNAWVAGLDINLNDNAEDNWSLQAQSIYRAGAGAAGLATIASRARAHSLSHALGVRYTARPLLLTRWQVGLTVAQTRYLDAGTAQDSVVPSVMWRIGQGIDVVGQYVYNHYGEGLGHGNERILQLGLSFSLEARYNDNIGERKSILNYEHGFGP